MLFQSARKERSGLPSAQKRLQVKIVGFFSFSPRVKANHTATTNNNHDVQNHFEVMLSSKVVHYVTGPYPQSAGTFRKKLRKNSGRPRKRSQSVSWNSPQEYVLGYPKPYNSRHLRLPEHFQNYLPLSTAGAASFFRIGSAEGLSELLMESLTVLKVFLNNRTYLG